MLFESRTSNTVSVDDDIAWKSTLVVISVLGDSFLDELLKEHFSIDNNFFVLLIFGDLSFSHLIFEHVLVFDSTQVLGQRLSVSCCHTNN